MKTYAIMTSKISINAHNQGTNNRKIDKKTLIEMVMDSNPQLLNFKDRLLSIRLPRNWILLVFR